jgi:GT2 family glycosyltransferase
MSDHIDISVVIPTYQRCASVRQTLEALARQDYPPDKYEVIVSIDGSEDGTREMLATAAFPYLVRVVWRPNRGRAAACNVGIRMAVGELIVFLDDDMEPECGFLTAHWRAHEGESRLGVMGAVPIALDPGSAPTARYVAAKFAQHLEKLAGPDYQPRLRDFYSGNVSVRHDVLLAVGLFDEDFTIYGNEDLELSLRLVAAGVRITYCGEALAWQRYTKDFAELAWDTCAKGQTAVLLMQKHAAAFDQLQLSAYSQTSHKRQCVRRALLWLSNRWPITPHWMVHCVTWLERRTDVHLALVYGLVLDHFYWLGVQRSLREQPVSDLDQPATRQLRIGLGV